MQSGLDTRAASGEAGSERAWTGWTGLRPSPHPGQGSKRATSLAPRNLCNVRAEYTGGIVASPFRLPHPVVGVTVVVGPVSVPDSTDRQGDDQAEKREG